MSRTQFARLLSERRKQLRLSIPQAAKVLRMRETVLEAFEEGDFEHLPALGYAQAMVASYARYLGLNPREITTLYEEEHEDYVRQVTGRDSIGLARLSDEPAGTGPASATSMPRPSRSSAAQVSPASRAPSTSSYTMPTAPSAGTRDDGAPHGQERSAYASSYRVDDTFSYNRRALQDSQRQGSYENRRDPERRYTSRLPEGEDRATRRRSTGSTRRGRTRDYDRGYSDTVRRSPRSGEITTRRVSSGQYRDDMRYDDSAHPYRPSSTMAGRQVSRGSRPPERPNVRRRQAPAGAPYDPRARSSRRREPQQRGFAGFVQMLADNPRRAVVLIIVGLALILLVILVFSIRSCASGATNSKQVPVVTTSAATTSSATTASAAEQQALSDAAARSAATSAAAANQQTIVTVSVAKGASSWVEITSDGEQKHAEQISGEWSESYTVTSSIDIKVGNPSAVSVDKNGTPVQLSTKTGGISSVTIQGTNPEAATTAAATSAATADQEPAPKNSGSSSNSGSNAKSSSSGSGPKSSNSKSKSKSSQNSKAAQNSKKSN